MALEVGSRLGHYDVTALIGEGGMGQVYQATDTKLNREVALKILPEAFASDPERLARFQREAQVLASLNHPNIGGIHGLEESDGQKALVLELIEGPTLADRIKQGPIPVDEALSIARQIAEGLEAAHEQGIIHRDLKPANIKLKSDGTVKVLDFGLAKAFQPDGSDPNMSQSPTISLTAAATQMGMVIGTAAYMAPEQAKGKVVDKRADVWAFGAVLYEMLTGQKPFSGEDVSTTLARVIEREPDWDALPSDVPPVLGSFLRRCLEKHPEKRVRDVGDLSLAIAGAFETGFGGSSSERPHTGPMSLRERMVWSLLTLVVACAVGITVWALMRNTTSPLTRLVMNLPTAVATNGSVLAIAPNGRTLVYTANAGGITQLYLRPMSEVTATPIPGTEGGESPFFSPDGEWIGFFTGTELKRVSVRGGPPVSVAEVQGGLTGTWGADDRIVVGVRGGSELFEVPANGGVSQAITTLDLATESDHDWPQILPGGEWLLFTVRPREGSFDDGRIVVESLNTKERRTLIEGGTHARYVSTGHLVYARSGDLLAVPFSLSRLEVTGNPVPMVQGVAQGGSGVSQFAIATDGTLAYVAGGANAGVDETMLVWVDREGQEELLSLPAADYGNPRLSPDGSRVSIDIREPDQGLDIWMSEVARGTLSLVTNSAAIDWAPLWTLDGEQLVFTSTRDGRSGLFSKAADGTGEVTRLVEFEEEEFVASAAWSPDGGELVFTYVTSDARTNIGMLAIDGDGTWQSILSSAADETRPVLSPNGEWVAYVSDETGQPEVYVERYPGLGDKRQISVGGGAVPLWSPDGRELFYRDVAGVRMMVVAITTEPTFAPGVAEVVFEGVYARSRGRDYDIAPNGERFLMLKGGTPTENETGQIDVVLHWTQELLERVPVD